MTPREVLMLPMQPNDSGAATVGGYLQALLRRLWTEEEGFSGKRPFGNSGWAHDLYRPLIAAGAVDGGSLDSDGYVNERGDADQVIHDAIDALFPEAWTEGDANRIAAAALRSRADELDPPGAM